MFYTGYLHTCFYVFDIVCIAVQAKCIYNQPVMNWELQNSKKTYLYSSTVKMVQLSMLNPAEEVE